MGIILFNYTVIEVAHNDYFKVRFRPLMGIILFNQIVHYMTC